MLGAARRRPAPGRARPLRDARRGRPARRPAAADVHLAARPRPRRAHARPPTPYLAMLGAGLRESRGWDDEQVAAYLDASSLAQLTPAVRGVGAARARSLGCEAWSPTPRERPTPALLEETIGANLERTVAAHGDREALVEVATGRRWTYAELDRDVDALARGPDRAPASRRATGSASGRRTAPSGRSCSTPPRRSARSWSTSTRPTAPTSSPTRSTSPGCGCWSRADGVQDQRLPRDGRGGARPTCPALERVVYLGTDDWDDAGRRRRERRRRTRSRERMAHAGARRPDQHPVHLRHHRLPQGRHAQPPQHPQQRLLRHRD